MPAHPTTWAITHPGEACGLRWADIDADNQLVHVRQAAVRTAHATALGPLKTASSRRTLRAPAQLMDRLATHRATLDTSRPADLVFPTAAGTPIDPSNLRRSFSQITLAAGLGHWHPNELRHSAVSLLSAPGLPLEHAADVGARRRTSVAGMPPRSMRHGRLR
ncbi:MAG: tyrosine-type recombinase/integrase [Myxococcales bacterium]|nr:tyrosine-type recombinase/integrase [Myxococcales bacterium]